MRKIASFGMAVLVFISGFATSVFAAVSNKATAKSYDQDAINAKRGKKQTATTPVAPQTNATPVTRNSTTRRDGTKCLKWDKFIAPDGYCYESDRDYQEYIKFNT